MSDNKNRPATATDVKVEETHTQGKLALDL